MLLMPVTIGKNGEFEMDIPVGYQLHITTWENDLDLRATKIISGLTEENVRFYLEIAQSFRSRNASPNGLGNGSVSSNRLILLIETALDNHPNITPLCREKWVEVLDQPDWLYEQLTEEILGTPCDFYSENYENFCRVFEKAEVFYYPADVVDVTQKFV